MKQMLTWTTVLPTEPGWYFWKPDDNTEKLFQKRLPEGVYRLEMCGLKGDQSLHLALSKDKNRYPAKWMAGSWAGPIPEPQEVEVKP
jgi:hypothetical protein